MRSSPIHKFQSIITHKPNARAKPKKRRKKRKKPQIITNLETDSLTAIASTNKALKGTTLNRRTQYYQHDNRVKAKSSSGILAASNEDAIEREIHYNEVAKKFKPIHNLTQNKNSAKPKKTFFKNRFKKNLKTVQEQKRKQKFAFMAGKKDCENKSTTNPTTTLALMQPQICLCACQNEHQPTNNNFDLRTSALANDSNELSSRFSNASNAATATSLENCSQKLATINNDFTKLLSHLQNQAPSLFFDHIFNNTKLFENIETLSRIGDSYDLKKAQQEKNAKLRQALNISERFVKGSTLNLDHKAKGDIIENLSLQTELDTKREETAAAAAKETSKRYASDRTPSMEHDLSGDISVIAAVKSYSPLKKKKKKKIRERSPSPERKKDKKKKSKKSKKESKPKKSKKERKRKGSESETIVDNRRESADEDSESDDIEAEVKKSRKKSKKDKKKRRNKRKELSSSSSDEGRSTSLSDKDVKIKKDATSKQNTYYKYRSRSRSREKSLKLNESHRYESAYRHSKRSPSRTNRRNSRSYSRSGKNLSNSRDEIRETQNSNVRNLSQSRESRERSSRDYIKRDRGYRRSTSRLQSRRENSEEKVKNIKRKQTDRYIQGKEQSPITDKRKRYSQSHSSTTTRKSCESTSLAINAATERHSYKRHSRTPNHRERDNRGKLNRSRSRSSSDTNEAIKCERKVKSQKKGEVTIRNDKDDKKMCRKKISRSISVSSTDTRTSISRTPSPKKEYTDEPSVSKSLYTQKIKEQKISSPSPIRTPTPQPDRSILVNNEKRKKDKKCSSSSKEYPKCAKETTEQKSRTPPPKVDKKPLSPRSSRASSELSYSPARRNPERYRDILENTRSGKYKANDNIETAKEIEWDRKEKGGKTERNQAKPIVRLQSQSDDESDATERNTETILDEFQELKHDRELNDLKMLEHLKTGLAAKAKEKIKTIEKMAASTSTNNEGEVSEKPFKRIVRSSLNDFLAANNVAPAVVATCLPTSYTGIPNSPPGAIYPQTFEEIKKEQESVSQMTENLNPNNENNKDTEKDSETQVDCKKSLMAAHENDNILNTSPSASPLRNNTSTTNKEKDRKRERDLHERERERESYSFYKERYLERRQKPVPNFYSTGGGGGGGGTVGLGNISVARRNNNNSMLNVNHRHRLNVMCNSGGVGAHHHLHSHLHPHPHPHPHPHHYHPNHKLINNHHNSTNSSFFLANNSPANPHSLLCNNHPNSSASMPFNRPSRINNTPLITATQFNNQMLSKQSNSILVNRRDHRTALSLGLSGTPCTNFSNSNLLLTKANTNTHRLHAAPVGHAIAAGHHHPHHHHHHHHHVQNTVGSSADGNSAQITDRILMAASLVAAQCHSLGVHSAASNAAAVAAANNLNFLHQQNKPKLVIKPFKINDSQPLVAALADSSLVDAIVSKVSTATVAAAESAARRSRSRSRRSHSRKRHDEKSSGASNSGGGERDGNRRHSASHSRSSSSTSSRSRGRSHSHRSSQSRTSQSSSSSHTSSRSSSSSSFGTSRSGTRSPSIPRRRGSPSFLDRRRITSARKRPIPYHRKLPSDASSCYCSSCCSRESSPHSRSPSQDSRSPLRFLET